MEAFYLGLKVVLLEPVPIQPQMKFVSRMNSGVVCFVICNFPTYKIQYATSPILDWLQSPDARKYRNAREELITIAITMADLYPRIELL